mgnify:FL=1|tara:strand:- start:298 stop:1047 length:750 start_codon:yes stop_codon:yes gene_type:complete
MNRLFFYKRALVLVLFILIFFSIKYLFFNHILQFIAEDKIWIHRVNSIEKLKEVQQKFTGVELDLVFNDTSIFFDVNHPPTISINLSLEEYFKNNKKDLTYWLDFKNLNKENQEDALQHLDYICKKNKINKSKVVVESPQIGLLKNFKDAGYQISYYYHWPGLFSLNEEDRIRHINHMKETISNDAEIILSADYRDYEILKNKFPDRIKMFWITKKVFSITEIYALTTIIKDDKVKSLLIQYKSKATHR